MNKQLVIPMSGIGARFIAAGYRSPKPLIEVAGKPVIQHILEMYPGWKNILFIVNSDHYNNPSLHLEATLMELAPTAKIHAIGAHKLGPSFAIQEAKEMLIDDGPIVINYCDFAGKFDLDEFENKIIKYDSVLLTYTGFHPHMLRSSKFAYLKMDEGRFLDIQEKQSYTTTPMQEQASAGAYSFINRKVLLQSIKTQIKNGFTLNSELYTSLTVKALIKDGGNVGSTLMSKFFQWGTPEDLQDFNYWMDAISAIPVESKYEGALPNHVVLLAGGKGARISAVTKDPKPLLRVTNKLLWEEAFKARNSFSINYLVVRDSLKQYFDEDLFQNIFTLTQETRGQADSALIGINSIIDSNPVTVLASDCILPNAIVTQAVNLIRETECDLVVWSSKNYPPALLDPNSFSWVLGDSEVSSYSLKALPSSIGGTLNLVTGNFTFKDVSTARVLIEKLIADKTKMINSEFYLDSTIGVALELGLRVHIMEIPHFISLGTRDELETFRYWSDSTLGITDA